MFHSKKYFTTFILFLSLCLPHTVFAEDINIALRAFKGKQLALKQWQSTADHLTASIPGYTFNMVPFENNSSLNQAFSRGEFQFCLTNPAASVEHQIRYQAQPIATLVNKRLNKGYSKFGSVIFTRSDRDDINTIYDLKGKTFIGADELGFGGWRVAWNELLKHNINPYKDLKALNFAGGNQKKVINSVLTRSVDAGSVRTDMLERYAASGNINLQDFKAIGLKQSTEFPFLLSTDLYPEWLFSSNENVDTNLKSQVANALLSIQEDSLAATSGQYVGWIEPLDYSSVDELLQKLKVGPYDVSTLDSVESLFNQYGFALGIIFIILIIMTVIILHIFKLYRHVTITQQNLKDEVATRKSLEYQLLHIQKMESLGQLTGGIAHDFNNMLAIIIGFTELSLNTKTVNDDNKLSQYLNQVMSTSERAKMLVKQMLTFSRTEQNLLNPEKVNVLSVVEELLQLLRSGFPKNITFNAIKPSKDLYINVNRELIIQALMNICLNSKDAIANHNGVITISAEIIDIAYIQCSSCYQDISGSYINIEIEDTGHGINEAAAKPIFEPFFSTKNKDKSTGMGLSIVHGIIHQFGGHILFSSTTGSGTTVKLLLPDYSKDEAKSYRPAESLFFKNEPVNSNKHILIVDDEVSITIYLNELLTKYGYKVTTFNNSLDALNYFKDKHSDIDLVLTDQTMPDLTGLELSIKMLDLSQEKPVILCSGYSDQLNEENVANVKISKFLEKPIQTDTLLTTIKSLLQ